MIDLLAEGCHTHILDIVRPPIIISEWWVLCYINLYVPPGTTNKVLELLSLCLSLQVCDLSKTFLCLEVKLVNIVVQ